MPRARTTTKGRPLWRRLRWKRIVLFGALGFTALLLIAGILTYAFARIPQPEDIASAQAVVVVDHQGRRIGRISGGADRVSIPLGQMPDHLQKAVIAVEDRRFYSHGGIAPLSILRAAFKNVTAGRTVQGGSTITQQYVKNAFVGAERSFSRKFKEAVLAAKLDRSWSKDDILEAYLNTIYFGRGAYGVEAAARTYFGGGAKDLSLSESAMLAALIAAPELFDPAREPELARERRDVVLDAMAAQGYVTEKKATRAQRNKVKAKRRRVGGLAPHFMEDVRSTLEAVIGARTLYGGGVTVQVTLDVSMQRAAERAVRRVYDRDSDPEVSLVAIDPADGGVRAMVGSRDFGRLQFNLATQAKRQPGSTFKAAVLAAGLQDGMRARDSFRAPASITLDTPSGPWKVWNYDRRDHGRLSVARATELSVNTVYAQMIERIGPEAVAALAEDLGVRSRLEAVPSLALGTSGVTTLDMASMYATLAARGMWRQPILIQRVTGPGGEVLYAADAPRRRVLDQRIADAVNEVLVGVVRDGTGRAADIGRPVAGKTGTTEDFRDALFAGHSRDLAAVVWNGYPKRRTLQGVRGINVTGGSFPARIWADFMRAAHEGLPARGFPSTTPTPSPKPTPSSEPSPSPSLSTPPPEPTVLPTGPGPTISPAPTPTSSGGNPPSPSPAATPTG